MKNANGLLLIGLGTILIILGVMVVNYFGSLVLIPVVIGIMSITKGILSRKNPRKKDIEVYDTEEKKEELEEEEGEEEKKIEVYDVEEDAEERKESEENEEEEIEDEWVSKSEENETKFCEECEEEIDIEAGYCSKCGTKQ